MGIAIPTVNGVPEATVTGICRGGIVRSGSPVREATVLLKVSKPHCMIHWVDERLNPAFAITPGKSYTNDFSKSYAT